MKRRSDLLETARILMDESGLKLSELEELTGVAGGAQVEVSNTVKDNKHDVNIGPTVVINM